MAVSRNCGVLFAAVPTMPAVGAVICGNSGVGEEVQGTTFTYLSLLWGYLGVSAPNHPLDP